MRPALLLVVLAACSRAPTAAPPPGAEGGAPAVPKGTLALGEPVTTHLVSLADVARDPGAYAHRTIATTGTVTAVCQARGCWMELADAAGQAHVRMHGHSFFVPRTAAGHVARVQATVITGDATHCEDSPPPAAGASLAKVELDATGVELD